MCGDSPAVSKPRPHELGGTRGSGLITATYGEGAVVDIKVDITANHKGSFQFRLCNADNSPCDKYEHFGEPLKRANDPTETRFQIPAQDQGVPKPYDMQYKLPDGFQCEHCVLQWWWLTESTFLQSLLLIVDC